MSAPWPPYLATSNTTAMILINSDKCWYTDHEFCYVLHRHSDLLLGGLDRPLLRGPLRIALFVLRTFTHRLDSVLRPSCGRWSSPPLFLRVARSVRATTATIS